MPLNPRPTRQPKTEQRYRKRTRNLADSCRKDLELGASEILDYRRFTGWLINRKPDLSRGTWRQYKASVVFFLEKEAAGGDAIAGEALDVLINVDVSGCVRKTTRTSGAKMKKVPAKDFRSIMRALDAAGSPWREDLKRWIVSGLLTGLRPIEWGTARMGVSGSGAVLVVDNAKASNGRAHGPTRRVLLDGLSEEEIQSISEHVARANIWEQAQQYEKFYHGCAALLARTIHKLWPKRDRHVTLYSMRHQFSANAKASGFTREELAAMMGHAVDVTAGEHYGKKTAGHEMVRVRPDPADVAAVRSVFKARFTPPVPANKIKPTKAIPALRPESSAD